MGRDRLPRARGDRPAERRDIVAKDLIWSRILLSLYFTIFLNQLDNLFPYTENGTIRPRSGLIGASFSWLGRGDCDVWTGLRRPVFAPVSAPQF
jgi:hypothetical protein